MQQINLLFLLPCSVLLCDEYKYKMVLVVNSQAQLSIGKTAAQVAHGAVSLYTILARTDSCRTSLQIWLQQGQAKVVLRGMHPEHLMQIDDKAKDLKLKTCLIHDAGYTEIPQGTLTVLAIFGKDILVKKVTSNLPLLK